MKNILKPSETPVSVPTNTGVCANKLQPLTAQTPVSDATDSGPCETPLQPLHRCQCCQRELPQSHFYVKNKQNEPDSYCKDCRKAMNRKRRKEKTCADAKDDAPPLYPVITQVGEREVRIELILGALQTVRENVRCKRMKQHKEEFLSETGLNF